MIIEKKNSFLCRGLPSKRRIERKGTFRQSGKWECQVASTEQSEDTSPSQGRWKRLRHSESYARGLVQTQPRASINHYVYDEINDAETCSRSLYDNVNNINSERVHSSICVASNSVAPPYTDNNLCGKHFYSGITGDSLSQQAGNVTLNNEVASSKKRLRRASSFVESILAKHFSLNGIRQRLNSSKAQDITVSPSKLSSTLHSIPQILTPKQQKTASNITTGIPELLFSKCTSSQYEFLRANSYRLSKSIASKDCIRNKLKRKTHDLQRSSVLEPRSIFFAFNELPSHSNADLPTTVPCIKSQCQPLFEKIKEGVTIEPHEQLLANGQFGKHNRSETTTEDDLSPTSCCRPSQEDARGGVARSRIIESDSKAGIIRDQGNFQSQTSCLTMPPQKHDTPQWNQSSSISITASECIKSAKPSRSSGKPLLIGINARPSGLPGNSCANKFKALDMSHMTTNNDSATTYSRQDGRSGTSVGRIQLSCSKYVQYRSCSERVYQPHVPRSVSNGV